MKRFEWFNKLEGKNVSAEEQSKRMIRELKDQTGRDLLDVYEQRHKAQVEWLNQEVDEKGRCIK